MRPTNYLPKPALLLSTLTALSLYGSPVYAQNKRADDDSTDGDNQSTDAPDVKTSSAAPAKTTSAAPAAKSSSSEKDDKPTSTAKADSKTSSQAAKTSAPQTTAKADSTTTQDSKPALTTSSDIQTTINKISSGADSGLTGLPTLSKYKPIPTYPAPTIPPTNNAPFMQHSSAPQGTVFIAVGAILGAFGLGILLWRAIVGFLLHRSVERAAQAQHTEVTKAGFPAPPAPFYKYTDHGSTMSLSAGRGVRRTNRGPIPSSNPSVSNLFFSPTAAASGNPGNRGSTFLPSGFYAAGNSSPGGHEHSISLTNLRPDSSRGHFGNPSRHTLNQTPPDSPSFNARRDISSSSLNLNRPPSQRAPSAFLDDLLADDPSSLPPPHMPPSRNSGYNTPSPLGSPNHLNRI